MRHGRAIATLLAIALGAGSGVGRARADEGGVSFWVPGQQGSFAALPGDPGWSMPVVYYHVEGDAGGARNFLIGGRVVAGLDVAGNIVFLFPTWIPSGKVLGAQAALALGAGAGNIAVD